MVRIDGLIKICGVAGRTLCRRTRISIGMALNTICRKVRARQGEIGRIVVKSHIGIARRVTSETG